MKIKSILISLAGMAALTACQPTTKTTAPEPTLKEAFGDKFLIGAAINTSQAAGDDSLGAAVVKKHFNAIVAENCMKSAVIHPEEDRYDFVSADSLMAFGEANGMTITGHCLIWHSQCAPWFFTDKDGKQVSADVLKQRMKDHIYTVVGRYKGRIHGWDVVNEAIVEDGSYRKSKFYEILGEEFIPWAFQCAHEADPNAELYYNDYGMTNPGRQEGVIKMVKQLKERGLRIDAVGMQGHMGMDYPTLEEFENSMLAYAALGVKVMITEWDMSALPTVNRTANISDVEAYNKAMNPYTNGLTEEVSKAWNDRMKSFFELFIKHSDIVTRVTAWGVSDGESWKNDFPMKGRTDYPLLFDRNHEIKPFLKELMTTKIDK